MHRRRPSDARREAFSLLLGAGMTKAGLNAMWRWKTREPACKRLLPHPQGRALRHIAKQWRPHSKSRSANPLYSYSGWQRKSKYIGQMKSQQSWRSQIFIYELAPNSQLVLSQASFTNFIAASERGLMVHSNCLGHLK